MYDHNVKLHHVQLYAINDLRMFKNFLIIFSKIHQMSGSRNSVVSIETLYRLAGPWFESQQCQEIFSSPKIGQTISGGQPVSSSMGIKVLSQG
jgi:hypothetical protein